MRRTKVADIEVVCAVFRQKTDLKQRMEEVVERERRTAERGMRIWEGMNIYC